ncbi:MAG TPA: hypothetical protein VH702_05840 [Vicinamibacterales bacterium]
MRIVVLPKEVNGAEVNLLRVGGTYDLPLPLAGLLLLEGKAVPEQRQRDRTPAVSLPIHQLIRLKCS